MSQAILKDIFSEFVALRQRQNGRSAAWANLEDKLMSHAPVLIATGLLSPKDVVSMAVEIENFRKQEQGTGVKPEDWLAGWLNGADSVPATGTQ
jgi:hypothetical protein